MYGSRLLYSPPPSVYKEWVFYWKDVPLYHECFGKVLLLIFMFKCINPDVFCKLFYKNTVVQFLLSIDNTGEGPYKSLKIVWNGFVRDNVSFWKGCWWHLFDEQELQTKFFFSCT